MKIAFFVASVLGNDQLGAVICFVVFDIKNFTWHLTSAATDFSPTKSHQNNQIKTTKLHKLAT